MSVYRVVGPACYRGHQPGDLFEATLDDRAEARAIGRGDIEIVEDSVPTVESVPYRLPCRMAAKGGAHL